MARYSLALSGPALPLFRALWLRVLPVAASCPVPAVGSPVPVPVSVPVSAWPWLFFLPVPVPALASDSDPKLINYSIECPKGFFVELFILTQKLFKKDRRWKLINWR